MVHRALRLTALVFALLFAGAAPASGADRSWSRADYWAFADRIMLHLDSW
jgi:hypothetical protein